MKYASLVKQAVTQALPQLTQSLRRSAYEQGWDAQTGRSLSVTANDFSLEVQMSDAAEDQEYGWSTGRPSAAVRQWSNDLQEIEAAIVKAAEKSIQGVL